MIRPQITKQISLQRCAGCVVIMQFVHERVDKGIVLWAGVIFDYLEEFPFARKQQQSYLSKK